MSFLSREQAAPRRVSARRAVVAPIRQKLLFPAGGSDCEEEEDEEEEEEEGGNSTGEDSAFQEADSPLSAARTPARPVPQPQLPRPPDGPPGRMETAAALPGDEGDSWEEEGFGSSPVKSPGGAAASPSPSPLKGRRCCGWAPGVAGGSSPLPDYPGTPPHKTFRKLRLFDTPHTPKVSGQGGGSVQPLRDVTASPPPRDPTVAPRCEATAQCRARPGQGGHEPRPPRAPHLPPCQVPPHEPLLPCE